MPAHQLATASPQQIATAVLAVLAGADLARTAADHGLNPADLADARELYHTAGLAALERRLNRWYHVRVQFPDSRSAETITATQLGPRLDQQAPGRWWFLRKTPHWRLRVRDANTAAVPGMLDALVASGTLTGWSPGIYEPETAAFGGATGITIAHDLFCADSRGVLDYVRHDPANIGRRELSLLLITALQHAAGLDWFERGDMYAAVAQLRPPPPTTAAGRIDQLAATMHRLLAAEVNLDHPLFRPDAQTAFVRPWLAAFTHAGNKLSEAATSGRLDRGLRTVLTHIVIFHWNRLGLSAATQGILARAARAATLPRSQYRP